MARVTIGRESGGFPSTTAFSFDQGAVDDDMADPSSLFDVDLALGQDFHHRASACHRPSKSSSDSKDFDFKMSDLLQQSSASPPLRSNLFSPADELFYKGKILPLYMSPRVNQSKNVAADLLDKPKAPGDQSSSIAVSCYLRRAGLDIGMVLDETNSREKDSSSSSSSSSSKSSSSSSSSGGEEDSSSSSSRPTAASMNYAASTITSSSTDGASGRFRWSILSLGSGTKKISKGIPGEKRNLFFSSTSAFKDCDKRTVSSSSPSFPCKSSSFLSKPGGSVCNSCGQTKTSLHDQSPGSGNFSTRFEALPSTSPLQLTFQSRTRDHSYMPRHSTGTISSSEDRFDPPGHTSKSLSRAKDFWRKYLKPFISKHHRATYLRPPDASGEGGRSGGSPSLSDKSFFVSAGTSSFIPASRQRTSRSTSVTPLASPPHSGVLLSAPPVANDHDVQGAIAYCKQSRAS